MGGRADDVARVQDRLAQDGELQGQEAREVPRRRRGTRRAVRRRSRVPDELSRSTRIASATSSRRRRRSSTRSSARAPKKRAPRARQPRDRRARSPVSGSPRNLGASSSSLDVSVAKQSSLPAPLRLFTLSPRASRAASAIRAGRVDDRDGMLREVVRDDGQHVAQQRIVRAAEHERVDLRVLREQLREVAARDERGDIVVDPAFFGERHEQRRGERRQTSPTAASPRSPSRTPASAPCRACRSRRCGRSASRRARCERLARPRR